MEAEAVDVGGGSFVVAGNPLPAAAAHEVCVGGPAGPEAGVELAGAIDTGACIGLATGAGTCVDGTCAC